MFVFDSMTHLQRRHDRLLFVDVFIGQKSGENCIGKPATCLQQRSTEQWIISAGWLNYLPLTEVMTLLKIDNQRWLETWLYLNQSLSMILSETSSYYLKYIDKPGYNK